MTQTIQKVQMGVLRMGWQTLGNPHSLEDIPLYDGESRLSIGDINRSEPWVDPIRWNVVGDMWEWSRTGTLLIADRVLVRGISEEMLPHCFRESTIRLQGKYYRAHLLPVGAPSSNRYCVGRNAWDVALNKLGDSNDIWHWKGISFWGHAKKEKFVLRGGKNARDWRIRIISRNCGFRPALEPLTMQPISKLPPVGLHTCKMLHVEPGKVFVCEKRKFAILNDGLLYEYKQYAWRPVEDVAMLYRIAAARQNGPLTLCKESCLNTPVA